MLVLNQNKVYCRYLEWCLKKLGHNEAEDLGPDAQDHSQTVQGLLEGMVELQACSSGCKEWRGVGESVVGQGQV